MLCSVVHVILLKEAIAIREHFLDEGVHLVC